MRRTLMIGSVILAFTGADAMADAAATADVRAVVQRLGDRTIAAFAADGPERRRRLLAEAAPALDFQEIGRNVLNYAGIKVPENREPEIIDGIAAYVKRVMATELERIRPEKAEIGRIEAKGEAEAHVALTLAGPQDELKGDWQLKKSGEGWRVTDILVAGNSLASHLGGKLSRHAAGGIEQLDEFLKGERERLKKQMAQR